MARKILCVEGDDGIGMAHNRGGEHMFIIGVRQHQPRGHAFPSHHHRTGKLRAHGGGDQAGLILGALFAGSARPFFQHAVRP